MDFIKNLQKNNREKFKEKFPLYTHTLSYQDQLIAKTVEQIVEEIKKWAEKNWNTHLGGNALISADELFTKLSKLTN